LGATKAAGAVLHAILSKEEFSMTILTMLARGASAGVIAGLLMFSAPALAGDNPRVAAEVIAAARAQWASEIAGQAPAQQLVSLADDYTEFNADYPTLLVGKAMAGQMAAIAPYQKAMFSDMQNARVQVYGDTAILTYNFAGITAGADGKSKPAIAKSTRVYVKQGDKWMLVHANFAPVQLPAQ
jgi:ketosteroid isomerase-like protein